MMMMMNKAQERRERITSEHEGVKYRWKIGRGKKETELEREEVITRSELSEKEK